MWHLVEQIRHLGIAQCAMAEKPVQHKIVASLSMFLPISTESPSPSPNDRMMGIGTDKATLDEGTVSALIAQIEEERLLGNELRYGMADIVSGIHPIAAILPQQLYTAEV